MQEDDYKNIERGCGGLETEDSENSFEAGCKCKNLSGCNKLYVFDWLSDVPLPVGEKIDICEIRFKNTRRGFYKNINDLKLVPGDLVAVEASPGHDIGTVSVTGPMVKLRMKKAKVQPDGELKKIYRKAKPADIDKWKFYLAKEDDVMLRSRQIADSLRLNMKIGDVEFQGDGTKAIFYYIADERVDFRELIKVMADEFKIRIEMKQIGARQEAGRIGGIGPCGRELCCTTWITNFVSVSTNSARQQELSLNPQKLAGQCGKLKCCLNYEIDAYLDAQTDFPSVNQPLDTMEGTAYHMKSDIFKRVMWYSYDKDSSANITVVPIDRVKEIMAMNRRNEKPDTLLINDKNSEQPSSKRKGNDEYQNAVEQDSITRFDKAKRKKKKNRNRNNVQPDNIQSNEEGAKDVNVSDNKPQADRNVNENRNRPHRYFQNGNNNRRRQNNPNNPNFQNNHNHNKLRINRNPNNSQDENGDKDHPQNNQPTQNQ